MGADCVSFCNDQSHEIIINIEKQVEAALAPEQPRSKSNAPASFEFDLIEERLLPDPGLHLKSKKLVEDKKREVDAIIARG